MGDLLGGEVRYVLLLFGLFVVPRFFQRFRIPAAIASFGLGVLAGPGLGWEAHDPTIDLFSTLGIVSLFLFAGLEVEVEDLAGEKWVLLEHVAIRAGAITSVAILGVTVLDLPARVAAIGSLALLTPSTGFILESLDSLGLPRDSRFWIRSKAIVSELLALAAMFVILQSVTAQRMVVSSAILLSLVLVVPLALRLFARVIVPHAPKSEFAFLIILAAVCAIVTRRLGVYYLVGAFVVGIAAQRLRERLPAMASERMLHAVEAFASLFVPFYFFHAGQGLQRSDLGLAAAQTGIFFLAVFVPIRLFLVDLHRRLRLGESFRTSRTVSIPLLPTLVFTLVLAQILRERFDAPAWLFGGLIYYAIGNTLLPSLLLRRPPPAFEAPELPPLHAKGVPLDEKEPAAPHFRQDERRLP
ncbi:MAG: cation:proton antiporter [Candidatus Eisenbacteria bacterium]|nr:cation:proton antiporter [Candidatus Eisenbacteria bacterium]